MQNGEPSTRSINTISTVITTGQGPKHVSAGSIQADYQVSHTTLRRWEKEGKVTAVRVGGGGAAGKRLYNLDSVRRLLGDERDEAPTTQTQRIIYARVSSAKQKTSGDLARQIEALQDAYPGHEVVSDVGSGLNFRRKGFLAILDRVNGSLVEQVVVAHRDRLCRFGIELVEHLLKKANTRLVVHEHAHDLPDNPDRTAELAEDLIAITTVFVARHHGQRSAANRRERDRKRKRQEDDGSGSGEPDPKRKEEASPDA